MDMDPWLKQEKSHNTCATVHRHASGVGTTATNADNLPMFCI